MHTLLKKCCDVERTVAAIYHQLSEDQALSLEVRSMFRELARDEEDHAIQLECALEVPQELMQAQVAVDAALGKAQSLLEKASLILEDLEGHPLSQSEVLEISMELEKDFREMHLFALATFPDEKIRTMFSRFARYEDAHLALLHSFREGPSSV